MSESDGAKASLSAINLWESLLLWGTSYGLVHFLASVIVAQVAHVAKPDTVLPAT